MVSSNVGDAQSRLLKRTDLQPLSHTVRYKQAILLGCNRLGGWRRPYVADQLDRYGSVVRRGEWEFLSCDPNQSYVCVRARRQSEVT